MKVLKSVARNNLQQKTFFVDVFEILKKFFYHSNMNLTLLKIARRPFKNIAYLLLNITVCIL
jgi:hypothetical protein